MRRKEMVAALGCLLVCAVIGGVMVFSPSIGSPVAMGEASKIFAGCDVQESSTTREVCSTSCGGTTNKPKLGSSPTGDTGNTYKCTTSGTCAYVDLSGSACGGG